MEKSVIVDTEKLEQIIKNNNMNYTSFGKSLGHSETYINHVRNSGAMKFADYMLVKSLYGVDVKKIEEIKEAVKDDSDLEKKLDEILTAINRLGNVEMQILEELHKKNKPSAFLR